MNDGWGFFGLIALVGLAGSFSLLRFTRGLVTYLGCLAWLVLPFAVVAVMIAREPHDDYGFSFFLTSLIVAVPWLGAALVGTILGAIFRKGKPAPGFEPPSADDETFR